jgi:hypothetical protein
MPAAVGVEIWCFLLPEVTRRNRITQSVRFCGRPACFSKADHVAPGTSFLFIKAGYVPWFRIPAYF